jgi:hypothetical protein
MLQPLHEEGDPTVIVGRRFVQSLTEVSKVGQVALPVIAGEHPLEKPARGDNGLEKGGHPAVGEHLSPTAQPSAEPVEGVFLGVGQIFSGPSEEAGEGSTAGQSDAVRLL